MRLFPLLLACLLLVTGMRTAIADCTGAADGDGASYRLGKLAIGSTRQVVQAALGALRDCSRAADAGCEDGAAHFVYFLYLAERAAGPSAATAGHGIARATLIAAMMVAAIAFAGTAIIALLGMDRRLDRRSFIGALIAALVLSSIPLVFVLNEAFYMNPEAAYFDPETGALPLVEIFNLAYPWIFLVSFPAAIVIPAALILDKRVKRRMRALGRDVI